MVEQISTGKPKVRIRRYGASLLVWTTLLCCCASISPVFARNYDFHIQEELPSGAYVGTIDTQSGVTYQFDGNPTRFGLDSNGDIRTTSRIDRDTLNTNPIELKIRPSSSPPSLLTVFVEVDDINDNPPVFPASVFTLDIFESVPLNSLFPIDSASDIDSGENGTIDYSVISGNSARKFKLGTNATECSRSELCIITQGDLDREDVAFYQLNISAIDRGKPSLRGYCLVNISILDFNDNSPKFIRNLYNGTVDENSKPGVRIVTVSATDEDQGANGQVRYYFEDAVDSNIFYLNETTGVIETKAPLDYEQTKSYTFEVIARDQAEETSPRESKVTVEITVRDVNDHKPVLSVFYFMQTIPENAALNTTVAYIRVSDDDDPLGPNGQVNLTLYNERGGFKLLIKPMFYELVTARRLDREAFSFYNITVTATDGGNPSESATTHVLITVSDVNDKAPTFTRQLFSTSITEKAQNGSFVYRLNASDSDLGSNSLISYSIFSGNSLMWFHVDSTSGLVTTVRHLDRERVSEVSLTVLAMDHGSPPLNSTTVLRVTIDDANDNEPQFAHSIYNETLDENSSIGTTVMTLNAIDEDTGANGNVTYAIDSRSQEVKDAFKIGETTGVLITNIKLDRETKSSYDIPVIARDHGNPQLSSRTVVRLLVLDVNDNHPTFYPLTYVTSVLENQQPQQIARVTATDPDEGRNGRIVYILAGGDNYGNFSINSSSGIIRTVTPLDKEIKGFYRLNVTARDEGGLYAKQAAVVEVTVQNQLDNPPEFEHTLYNFSVYENVAMGTYVGKVFATTKDSNGNISYSISSGDPYHLFIVDVAGGIIMVDGVVDREEKDEYFLHIIATAGTLHPLSAFTSVNIDILDRNDNSPDFSGSSAQVTIDSAMAIGKGIYHAKASDEDAGLNGVVHYQLTVDGSGLFKINATTGVVSLARKIMNIDDAQYVLPVLASDMGAPPLHSTLMLTVVISTNHPPRFIRVAYSTHIPGNFPVGKHFLAVSAVDQDSGNNGEIVYGIARKGNEEGLFDVFPEGTLYVKKQLDQAKNQIYIISVTATDQGNPPLSSAIPVTIYIQNSNQHQSLFANNTFHFSVIENQLPGTKVGQLVVKATDSLETKNIVYSLFDVHGDFFVNSATGEITTKRMFDCEQLVAQTGQNIFAFQAQALYNDSKQDIAIVVVSVLDLNDNPPQFPRSVFFLTVSESSQSGTVVHRVMASDPDEGIHANFTYSIVGGSGTALFDIDPVSGNLILRGSLDREKLDHYTLTIRATDVANSTVFSEALLEITVGDTNDNKPIFTQNHRTVQISEDRPVKSPVAVVKATDSDEGVNAEIAYAISSGNLEAVFDINHLTGEIFLIKPLDYERTKSYSLNISAVDRGIPPQSSVAWVLVDVLDANDNAPKFQNDPATIRIPENVTVGAPIGQCSATDLDSGRNGQITYSVVSQASRTDMLFDVNPQTCDITTRQQLDHEKSSFYRLSIKATDNASPEASQLSTIKEINIVVQDVNDNIPRFVTAPAVGVLDSISSNSVVMTISAQDPDSGTNGLITYNIESGNTGNLFRLDPNTGKLFTQSLLPANKLSFPLKVSAKDSGKPHLMSEITVTVFKRDQTNSGPTFSQATYTGFVQENSDVGTSVLQVQAFYSPSLPNSRIKYFITSDTSHGLFVINEDSGEVKTGLEVDRESLQQSVFILNVFAVDLRGPNPRTSSSARVEITVQDQNDNSPVFMFSIYKPNIPETLQPGGNVTTVSATDQDEGLNAKIEYSITNSDGRGVFQINSTSGQITTLLVLTRKPPAKYMLNVTAKDGGNPSRSSSCVVMVTVIDVNDNVPQFSQLFYSFDVYEGVAIGSPVGLVTATDGDTGDNSRVTYSIVGSDRDVFLDPVSGALTVARDLDRERVPLYILNVSATDNGVPSPLRSSVEVYISVLDRNDNAPRFSQSAYTAVISEAVETYSDIVTVSATDADFGTNALITYTILSGNNDNAFAIYPNGTIYNMKAFDREIKSSYVLTVMVQDQAVPVPRRLSGIATVVVNITDINDNKPYFISANVTHVSENAKSGDVVTTVVVVDEDTGSNSEISFSLVKVDQFAPFSLGRSDGVLRVDGHLDREVKDKYVVKVTATDKGKPAEQADQTITIIVNDYNDYNPVFQSSASEVRVYENISIGSEVTSFSATDADQGVNSEVRYSIVKGNEDGSFEVNPVTGLLETTRALDRETTPNYTLVIRASDLGVPELSTDMSFTVVLLDINDNTPTFSKLIYTTSVPENHVEANIVTVTAKDSDEGQDGSVSYEIISGNDGGVFTIDTNTATIGLRDALDREKQAEYTLTVQATDGGSPPRVGETTVVVKVSDENDNPPEFLPDRLKAFVRENENAGTFVAVVTATDIDAGSNANIKYSLENDNVRFAIDDSSGTIKTKISLDRERGGGSYDIVVLGTDQGKHGLVGRAYVHVTVEDVNDFDPVFSVSSYDATVQAGAPPGTFVIMVSAKDSDLGPNAESEYTIMNSLVPAVFSISPATGIISVARNVPSSPSSYTLTVKATNVNAPQRTDTTNVPITVSQGSFPSFIHNDQSITVSEAAPVGAKLVKLNATGHTAYFIAAGNVGDVFEVDQVQGDLKVKKSLDFETQKNYTVVVGAKDGNTPAHSGFTSVDITVTDENDNPPVFNQSVYRATIPEELPQNTTVLWVRATDADTSVNAVVEYNMVQDNNQANSAFGMSLHNGRVFTKVQLDRENISSYTFTVRALDVANRTMKSEAVVVVSVQDIDDNAPVFEGPLSASLYENVSVGFVVAELRAKDADVDINARLQFGFATGTNLNGTFSLDSGSGDITLSKSLDREQDAQYTLQVTVSDSLHTTTANFTVVVLDFNDEMPRFPSSPLIQKVSELSVVGTAVMNASAVDDDVGSNAEVLYSILPSASSDSFTIDRQTGILRLSKVLVYNKPNAQDNSNFYNLTVQAKDAYFPFHEQTVHVVIEITDVNDHAPVFEFTSYHFFATRNKRQGDIVGRVQAFDEQVVRYESVSGNGSSAFNIVPNTGAVAVKSSLDKLGLFYIRVKASDMGQPSMESFSDVFVEVIEENLYSPEFKSGQYRIPISETLAVGEEVLTVTATDSDTGTNGEVFYYLVGGDARGEFGIGLKNGSIYVNKPLDYELIPEYKLNVSATDGGRMPRSKSVIVTVQLTNQNDNPPVFTPLEYDAYIAENAPPGAPAVTVTAVDPDKLGSQIMYRISTADLQGLFIIDPISGQVTSNASFDYEVRRLYELSIVAEDGMESQPHGIVRVHITSVNEFTPQFSKLLYRASVAENAAVGQSVTQISASDQDQGPGGEVVYELVGNSNSRGFVVDQSSGVLSVSGKLDSERTSTVTLRVIAKNALQESVTPNNTDQATIVVTVTDANDAPRFLQSQYNARVSEDVAPDRFIANVTAVDDDDVKLPSGASITYGILHGNIGTAFKIDSVSGVIRTAQKLDREVVAVYRLTVTATDQGLPPMSGNATLLVHLDDVNDNPPHLVPVNCTGMVTENEPAGTSVITLQAQDPDVDPNRGPYTFTFFGTNYGKFQLDSKSGRINTTAELDRENVSSYHLSIQVADNGSPRQANISSCVIFVTDENDNPPKATPRVVHVNSFNKFAPGPVANVPPEDPDVDDVMSCQILRDVSEKGLFSFPPRSCFLNSKSFSGAGDFNLSVNGSDGKSSIVYNVQVRFFAYSDETVNKSVTVRIRNSSPAQFLEQYYQSFLEAVDRILPRGYVSQVFSVKPAGRGFVDLSVVVRKAANSAQFLDRETVSVLFAAQKSDLEQNGKVDIETVDYTPCVVNSPCRNSGECTSFIQSLGTTTIIDSIAVIFLSVDYEWRYKCVCKPDHTGVNCEISDKGCNSKPCRNGGTCVAQDSSYICRCPVGYAGSNCETDVNECLESPCKFGGRCENTFGSYKCQCKPGYLGRNCSSGFDFCQVTTCLTTPCTPSWAPHKCECSSGAPCQCACVGFESVSYLKLPTLLSPQQEDFNNITFEFSTAKNNGLLLYNADGKYQKDSDFIALEIVDGKVRLSFNLGYDKLPTVVNVDKFVADGQWHRVVAVRNKKLGDVSVDACCRANASSQGNFQQLNLLNSPLYIGGIKDVSRVLYHPGGHIQTHDFLGCMRNVFINGKRLDPNNALESAGITDRCPRLDQCGSQPCQHGGTCVDYWFDYICECTDGHSGRNCEEEVKPVKFSSTSFLILDFKESYRREQQLKEKENNSAVTNNEERLSTRFRSRQDGLILLATDSSSGFTVLEIKSGGIEYSFQAENTTGSMRFTATSASVTDGEWHNVTLLHQDKSVTVTLDSNSTTKVFDTKAHDFLGANIQSWFLGGFNSSPPGLSLKKFQGCMEDLSIDGLHVPFSGPNKFVVISTQGGAVDEGCDGSGACTSVDCSDPNKPYCFEEWEGYTCISDKQCKSEPCENNATCLPQKDSSFGNFTGSTCGIPCENTFGSYKCQCKPGYLGRNCSSGFDFCQVTTCLTTPCTPSWAPHKCECSSGAPCQCACVGFESVSYLKLPTLLSPQQEDFNNITFEFSTAKNNGLLLYNADGKYQKDSDFIALEIVDGKVRLSFNLGYKKPPTVVNVDKFVADGQWHRVVAVRNKKLGDVSVDACCRANASSQGNFQQLNLLNSPLYIGGIKDVSRVLYHPGGHIQTHDFLGCMRNVFINGKRLDPNNALESAGITDRCPRLDQCGSQPCQHGGTCVDYWFDYICECTDGHSGRNCEEEVKPVKFSSTSFLILDFKESYRREQQLKEKENNSAVTNNEERLSTRFRSRQDGLILLATDSSSGFTVLEIKSGGIEYSFQAENTTGSMRFTATSASVTDGEWHNVTLLHQDKSVTVTLDSNSTTKVFDTKAHDFLGANIQSWFLGGFNSSPPGLSLKKFQGCMEDLSIDGLHVPFSGPNKFVVISTQGGAVDEGCDGSGACTSVDCSDPNKPYCFEEWEGYTCISDKQCKSEPCENNATCLPQKDSSFLCTCYGNFTGSTCGIPGVCWPHPCGEKMCHLGDSGGYKCVAAGQRSPEDSSLSAGVIAAIVFFVVLLIFIIVAVVFARRYRLRQKECTDKTAGEFEAAEVAADVQDASQRTSPSHSSDDSGVVIRNPSQKSLTDLRPPPLQNGKDIVIHNVGAPEDYQIKLTKSEEKLDPGFSESDGEFIVQNNLALGKEIPIDIGEVGSKPPHHRSTPLDRENIRQERARTRERKIPNPHFRHGMDKRQPLSRSVLDPRLRGPTYVTPSRRFRKGSLGSSSSDELPDFSDAGHKSDNNSEMLEHYDIEVASLGYSEVSYQYDPSMFKDNALNRREPPGLSPAEIEKLRKHPPSGSLLDAVSSTSGEDAPTIDKLSSVLEVPDTSSESSDDTFTCSEFEYDNDEPSREDNNERGSMVFSKLADRDATDPDATPRDVGAAEHDGRTSHRGSLSTLNVSDEEILPNTMNRKPVNGTNDLFNWDDVLNWGLRYHNLRGVYKDIAQLKDSTPSQRKKEEEYV